MKIVNVKGKIKEVSVLHLIHNANISGIWKGEGEKTSVVLQQQSTAVLTSPKLFSFQCFEYHVERSMMKNLQQQSTAVLTSPKPFFMAT